MIVSRVHGDCRGGKPAPTLFALALYTSAALSGCPPGVALSMHRLLACWTYFMTGLRKLYCTGAKWCDGRNLQLMLGIQGLYHDSDARGWNFFLARYRRLCCGASIAVVGLQLALPLAVVRDDATLRALGFAAAMAFHASNHVLWRINFFVAWCPMLLALLAPGAQLTPEALLASGRAAAAPAAVLGVYLLAQLGHALDLLTEKALARLRRHLDATAPPSALPAAISGWRDAGLVAIWLAELHLLGDYYSSYWPTTHPLRGEPVVCVVAMSPDGGERLAPAVIDFYWRRDMSSGVKWPRADGELCEVRRWSGWSDAKGTQGSLQVARGAFAVNAAMNVSRRPVADVVRALAAQLESTFLGPRRTRRLHQPGADRKLLLRARVLEADGTAFALRTLWECPLESDDLADAAAAPAPVSYTHLTLPTICSG